MDRDSSGNTGGANLRAGNTKPKMTLKAGVTSGNIR
jgi:hypothetical protein